MNFIKKPYVFAIIFSVVLLSCNSYVLLKTFILPEAITTISPNTKNSNKAITQTKTNATTTENTYKDENISISIDTIRSNNTTIYVADIKLSSAEYLKTALAKNTFGTNITSSTSETAENNNAIFAVNGDYYGANTKGYVIKNGVVYRSSNRNSNYQDLGITSDGEFLLFSENEFSTEELLARGIVNTFAFGPALIVDEDIAVSQTEEVGKAMAANPRTAIGIIDNLHYIIIVSDGRTDESTGLSLYELAKIMQTYGVKTAYNLDGGGSSTMYFNGKIINNPTTNGNTIKERAVSDIVYIGY